MAVLRAPSAIDPLSGALTAIVHITEIELHGMDLAMATGPEALVVRADSGGGLA